jgi:protein-L-isoaspartate O-methyltransferase
MEKRLERRLNSQVRNAFLQVPRHLFIDHYYRQQGNYLAWDRIATPVLEDIYCDEALVTKIDESGFPISSSSQPGVMARQLEALDLRPGLSVLEIGTGTGYNAALIGALVGSTGQIISIDIDQELITTAIQHLDAAGVTNVLAAAGDGFQGYPEYAPYNRLLATCAVRALPRSWVEQLAPGGILLVNLRLNLSSVFLLLKKVAPTTLEGHLLDIDDADGAPRCR